MQPETNTVKLKLDMHIQNTFVLTLQWCQVTLKVLGLAHHWQQNSTLTMQNTDQEQGSNDIFSSQKVKRETGLRVWLVVQKSTEVELEK